MKKIGAAKFKEQCLALLDKLTPEGLIITKHGKPVAKLTPFESEGRELIGTLKGRVKVLGDIQNTGIKWDAQS